MKTTINDIAKMAKVSKSTVSKVLNNSPSIPESTKQRIRSIMEELNYIPNSIATQLAKKHSNYIGFILDVDHKDRLMNPFIYSMICGAESVTCTNQYELTLSNVSMSNEDLLNRYVYSGKLNGMLILLTVINEGMHHKLAKLQFPYVVIGKPTALQNKMSWVDIDNTSGSYLAVQHLSEQGYERIAFLGGPKDEGITATRLDGFLNMITELYDAHDPKYILHGSSDESGGYDMMNELLALPQPPDAIVCSNNYIAFGALRALQEKKIRIPDDIGIVTFDNFPLAPYTTPALTALDIDTFYFGKAASEMLLRRIQQPEAPHEHKLLLPKLIARSSSLRKK